MNDRDARMDSLETRVGGLTTEVGLLRVDTAELRGEVGALRGEVGELRGELRGSVDGLREELRGSVDDCAGSSWQRDDLRGELRGSVDDLRGEMRELGDDLRSQIGEVREGLQARGHQLDLLQSEMGVVKGDLRSLALVVDRHSQQLDTHGRLLAEIKEQLTPMKDIKDFMQRIADEHERRITDLERHTGLHPQAPPNRPA